MIEIITINLFILSNNSFGNWGVEGYNGCNRSDYILLSADQNQQKFTYQDAQTGQLACRNTIDGGYLIKINSTIDHKSSTLNISLKSNTLSDFTMVDFGIRKFAVSSNLCPDQLCTACNDQYTCLSCSNNYLVSFDGRSCLQACPTNYLIKQGRCVQSCGYDSILDVTTSTCIVCDPNCQLCQSKTFCTKCYSNYYQFRGQCYQSCPINSIPPTDGSNQCKECSSGCLECSSTGSCRQCQDKYVLISGKCEKCADANCAKCQNSGIYDCLSCDSDYYFSERKCIPDKCQDDNYRVANKECQVCMGGFYYDLTQHTCIECHSLCHDCTGTSWDECKECSSSLRWRLGQTTSQENDLYSSKLGICDCQNSNEFDTMENTCQEIGHWDVLSDILLFVIFFASVQLAYRGKWIYLMNFMYLIQSLSLLGYLNMPYPYFLQQMFDGFNRVNLPGLFPRVFQIDQSKMPINGRSQTVYFSNSPSGIEDIFSYSKLMLYYDTTSNFILNIPNYIIINTIPFFAYVFIRVYERMKSKKHKFDRVIRNEIIPFFLYHSLISIFIYMILQLQHASTESALHILGTICSVLTLVALILITYFHTYSLLRSVIAYRKKEKDHNIFRFSLYLREINFTNGNIFQQNFRSIQILKQFILVCCIVGAYNNSITQAILVLVFEFLYYMILIIVRPFTSDNHNKQQILYETLLFFCIFLACWYEFSFSIEGQSIKQFVGIALILGIYILLAAMTIVTVYNFYIIEKPIFKSYMEKRRMINEEKERQKIILRQKKNSITEYAKNDGVSQDKNNEISDSDSEKSGPSKNPSNKLSSEAASHKPRFQTPKNILPYGLKSNKNQSSTANKNGKNQFFNQNQQNDDDVVQVGPDYRDLSKEYQQNNSQILISEMPPVTGLNGGQSRRNPYAQNNQSMSYYLNETDQNIITETFMKQQNENGNILSILDDEINHNLNNQSVVRFTERQLDNNDQLYSLESSNKYNFTKLNEANSKKDYSEIYDKIDAEPNPEQNKVEVINNEKPFVSQSIKSEFYDKQSYYKQQSSSNLNDISGLQNKTTRIEDAPPSFLEHSNSNQSIILQRNENYQPLKTDNQSFGQAENKSVGLYNDKSVAQFNEEDVYNKTFLISHDAIQNVTDHQSQFNQLKNDNLKRQISKTDHVHVSTDQPIRTKSGAQNQSLQEERLLAEFGNSQVRLNTSNTQNTIYNKNVNDFNTQNNETKNQESMIIPTHNNYASNQNISSSNIHNNINNSNSVSQLNESINQSIDPIRGNNQSQRLLKNSSTKKGVFQQTGRQLSTIEKHQSQKQEIVKSFKESPSKPPQKFATKKKKNVQNSKIDPSQQKIRQPTEGGNNPNYTNDQADKFIKQALDTELMYKWKDQSYNYDQEDDEY